MNPKTPSAAGFYPATLTDSFTPREIAVLARRFGIEAEDFNAAELESLAKFIPPRGGNGSQGGAPVHAVTTDTSTNNNKADQSEIPDFKKTRA